MVITTQLTVPFHRAEFEKALDSAHGENVENNILMHSKIMHSYKKIIWDNHFDGAFASKTHKSGRKRPRRTDRKSARN